MSMVLVMKGKRGNLRPAGYVEAPVPVAPKVEPAAVKPARLAGVYDIYRLVADHCGIPFAELTGVNRFKHQVRARQMAIFLAREVYPSVSLHRLGSVMNRDHTTVLYSLDSAKARMMTDAEFRADVQALREKVEEIGVRRVAA